MYIVSICDFETQKVGDEVVSYKNSDGEIIYLPEDVDIKLFGYKTLYIDGEETQEKTQCYVLKKDENLIDVIRKCFITSIEGVNELWFNNSGKFDALFVLKHLIKKGYKYTHKQKLFNNQYTFLGGDGIGYLNVQFKINKMLFIIKDFVKIGLASVQKMGKVLGMKKLKESGAKFYEREFDDFTEEDLKEYIEYCIRDVNILADYMKKYNDENEFLGTKMITAAGMAINYLVKEWENDDELLDNLDIDKVKKVLKFETFNNFKKWYKKCALSYFGGYTNFNKKYQGKVINQKIKVYDINSAYPWAMIGNIPYKINEKCNHKCKHLKMYRVIFKNGVVKKGFPPILGIKSEVKDVDEEVYLSELKNADVYIWDFKLEMLNNYYNNIEYDIVEIICFKTYPLFKKFIDKYYKIKEDISKQIIELTKQDKVDILQKVALDLKKELAKLCLNSTYGKFGENPHKDIYYHTSAELKRGDVIQLDNFKYIDGKKELVIEDYVVKHISISTWKDNRNRPVYQYVINKCHIESANNVIIASYITERVRCKLFEIIKINPDEWLYSDTDSLIVTDKFEFPHELIDKTKLGYWDIEGEYEYCFILGTKKYVLAHQNYVKFYENEEGILKTDDKIRICGGGNIEELAGVKLADFKYGVTLDRINPHIVNGGKYLTKSTVKHIIMNKKPRIIKGDVNESKKTKNKSKTI